MIESLCAALEETSLAVSIAQSAWLFPLLESAHVLSLVLVIGSIAMVDLRVLGLTLRDRDVAELTGEVLPWTWIAFVFAAITGCLLFISAATRYIHLLPFQVKMLLLIAAAINMLAFHFGPYRRVSEWGKAAVTPLTARIPAALSLLLWLGIVGFGRWIGFV